MNIPHASASSATIRHDRRHTDISAPSVSRRPCTRLGHSAHFSQVNSLDTTGISDGQSKLHHEEAVPMLDRASFRLALHVLQGHIVREFSSAEMHGLGFADADDQKDDAREIGVFVRVRGEVFFVGHGSTVHAPKQPATITL